MRSDRRSMLEQLLVPMCAGAITVTVACGGGTEAGSPAAPPVAPASSADIAALCAKADSLLQGRDQTCSGWLGRVKANEPAVFACVSQCIDASRSEDDAASCVSRCPKSVVAARLATLAEATRSLTSIESASKNKYGSTAGDAAVFCGASSPDPTESGGNPQPAAVPRATTAIGDWSGGVWKCLHFSFAGPSLCQYDYVSSGRGRGAAFTATATCDHDGDGKGTVVTLKGKVDDKTGQVVRDSLVVTGDDDE